MDEVDPAARTGSRATRRPGRRRAAARRLLVRTLAVVVPLRPTAMLYLVAVAAATAAFVRPAVEPLGAGTDGWPTFVLLAAAAAFAQLFVVDTPRNHSHQTSTVFMVLGVLILPLELLALLPLVQHVPEWVRERYPWYIQTFNICNHTLDALAAWVVARFVLAHGPGGDVEVAMAGVAACAVYIALNYALLGGMVLLARGAGPRRSGLFSFESLSTDLALALLAVPMAYFWTQNRWLVPIAAAPLILIHRSLSVPTLEELARTDAKTGLFNARQFSAALQTELARVGRGGRRALSVIIADVDLLRDVNNTYGHLAGDAVLEGVARVFGTHVREGDVPARFGGEEFAVLLPGATAADALDVAERIRRGVAEARFAVATCPEPLRATLSIGVATVEGEAIDAKALVHRADVALYRAKAEGRNRVVAAARDQDEVGDASGARATPLPA